MDRASGPDRPASRGDSARDGRPERRQDARPNAPTNTRRSEQRPERRIERADEPFGRGSEQPPRRRFEPLDQAPNGRRADQDRQRRQDRQDHPTRQERPPHADRPRQLPDRVSEASRARSGRDISGMPVPSFDQSGPRRDGRPTAVPFTPGAARPAARADLRAGAADRATPATGPRPQPARRQPPSTPMPSQSRVATPARTVVPARPTATVSPQPLTSPQPSASVAALPAQVRFREVSPTAELTSFAQLQLRPETRGAVDGMGITVPTPIQAQAIPVMLQGDDVVGQARTGSGKTLAFSLPIVERCDPAARGVQALILVPTRELAIQVGDVVEKLARARRLRLTLLYGGRSLIPEARALAGGAQIVVGTPGRTLDHLRQGNLHLDTLRIFVLDEGDEMLDRGFAPDVERILARTPATRQTALFSATVPPWVMETAARHLQDPVMVRVDTHEAPPEIEHIVYDVDPTTRSQALRTLLDRRADGPIIVFGRTKHGVKKLARQLETEGFPVVALQGNLSQKAREKAMADFRSGAAPILLATNVAARGIDVADVSQVINYEVPESAELFTHRVGRTGRMGKSGEAITFVTPEEAPKWRQIERALGKSLPRQLWTGPDGEPVPVTPVSPETSERPARAPRPAFQGPRSDGPRWQPRRRRPSGPYGQSPAR